MDKAVVLMDKNTMMKMVIRGQLDKDPNLKKWFLSVIYK